MEVCLAKPTEISDDCVTAIAQLVKVGGALQSSVNTLKGRISSARLLAICRVNGIVSAAAVLKNPDPVYRGRVFAKASVPIAQFQAAPELGYITVAQTMRRMGLGMDLAKALLKDFKEPCYATTDSEPMKRILQRLNFFRQGKEWKGQRGSLSLWTLAQ